MANNLKWIECLSFLSWINIPIKCVVCANMRQWCSVHTSNRSLLSGLFWFKIFLHVCSKLAHIRGRNLTKSNKAKKVFFILIFVRFYPRMALTLSTERGRERESSTWQHSERVLRKVKSQNNVKMRENKKWTNPWITDHVWVHKNEEKNCDACAQNLCQTSSFWCDMWVSLCTRVWMHEVPSMGKHKA